MFLFLKAGKQMPKIAYLQFRFVRLFTDPQYCI